MDGRSLLPVLTGGAEGVRQVLHGEHAPQYSAEQAYHLRDRPEGFSDGQRLIAGCDYKLVLPFMDAYKVDDL